MNLGIVTDFDNNQLSSEITDTFGSKLSFYYKDGQNMICGDDLVTPKFSGHHDQPSGYSLKLPAIGDPVSFTKSNNGTVKLWGYVRHFVDLAEKQNGTRFAV